MFWIVCTAVLACLAVVLTTVLVLVWCREKRAKAHAADYRTLWEQRAREGGNMATAIDKTLRTLCDMRGATSIAFYEEQTEVCISTLQQAFEKGKERE